VNLRIHPLAEMIPAMSEEEFADLKADIEANGQAEPITLYRGDVLDGRHRSRACEELSIQPLIREYTGDQPAAYVLSLNVKRRNLTPSQRAAIVVDFMPRLQAEARERQSAAGQNFGRGMDSSATPDAKLSPSKRASEDAGALVGVSGRTVERARRVQEEAPEDFERVKAGETTVNAANEKLKKPAAGKREAKRSTVRLEGLIDTFTNSQTLLRATNVDAAIESINTEEATKWAQLLRSVRTDLSRLITALEGRT
jgi:ParB-like chromosome segregation protein Spo0J